MTIFSELRKFANELTTMVTDLAAAMKSQRDAGSYRAQDGFRAFIVGTGAANGVGATGDMSVEDLGQTNNVYLHLKLPLNSADDKVDFNVLMEGYNYGNGKIINVTWSGHMDGATLVKNVAGSHTADVYLDGNGNIVLSIYFVSIYYTTFNVECLSRVDNKRVVRGQIQGKVSLSSQVTF